LGARVVLRGGREARLMRLVDLVVGSEYYDLAEHELVVALKEPKRTGARANLRFRTTKLAKRFESDISAVCAAVAVEA
ncbi:xanthine dehydrogenase small subunit, partial [Burkholderia pseudomallei]